MICNKLQHWSGVPQSCISCKVLQILQNVLQNVLQILYFAVVAGFQLCFFTNFLDIYILINYLKVLICILYYLISFSVMKIGKFDILNFLEKKLDLEKFSTYFVEKNIFFGSF